MIRVIFCRIFVMCTNFVWLVVTSLGSVFILERVAQLKIRSFNVSVDTFWRGVVSCCEESVCITIHGSYVNMESKIANGHK